ncbi:MAG: VCBS repeat-containing protein, partial [Thermodesulfobacteriota bacterium]|nr:VCBS repeat-containing protein [Thermodesulfobacteriota bacterium]
YRDDDIGSKLEWRLYKVFTAPEKALFGFDRFSGDFNGDGFTDFLLFDREQGEWIIGETGDNTIRFRVFSRAPQFKEITRWLTGNFNGDGRTDIGFYSKTDNKFWIGEATPDGFRYRIYNELGFGNSPDPDRVMTTPLPEDDVKIEQTRAIIADSSRTAIVDYKYNNNYYTNKGEMPFAGYFSTDGTGNPEAGVLIFDRNDDRFYYCKEGNEELEDTGISIDIEDENIQLQNDGMPDRYRNYDGILYYEKQQSYQTLTHQFNLIYDDNGFRIDSAATFEDGDGDERIVNFDIEESLSLVDQFIASDSNKYMLLLDDQREGGAQFCLFNDAGLMVNRFNTTGYDFDHIFRSVPSGDNRANRGLFKFFTGRFTALSNEPAQILMLDMTLTTHSWYLGNLNGSEGHNGP